MHIDLISLVPLNLMNVELATLFFQSTCPILKTKDCVVWFHLLSERIPDARKQLWQSMKTAVACGRQKVKHGSFQISSDAYHPVLFTLHMNSKAFSLTTKCGGGYAWHPR